MGLHGRFLTRYGCQTHGIAPRKKTAEPGVDSSTLHLTDPAPEGAISMRSHGLVLAVVVVGAVLEAE